MEMDTTTYSDTTLFQMLAASSHAEAALEELYNRYSQRLYAYCRRIVNDREAAEDILQECFVQLYKTGQKEEIMSNLAGFLFRVARNLCLNYKKKYDNRTVSVEEFHFPVYDQSYENKELSRLIADTLELMPDDYREIFVLREYNCLSYQEIAELLGISLDMVKTRIFRAKKKMREILAPYIADLKE